MAGDITPEQQRFLMTDGLTVGCTYFAKDGNLHAGPGDFCPFPDHPPKQRYFLPRVDVPGIVEVPESVYRIIQGYLNDITLQEKQRAAVKRFKRSKLRYRK